MHIPEGFTEAEVLAIIETVIVVAVSNITIPGFDKDDILQEARIVALEGLQRYDPRPGPDGRPTRPLDRFLFVHTRNRILNERRRHWVRADTPCKKCHNSQPCGENGQVCEKYKEWHERQRAKAAVRSPQHIEHIDDQKERNTHYASDVVENAELKEMLTRIDQHLDVELRATYLQMRAGKGNIPKAKRLAVEKAIRAILADADVDEGLAA